MKHRNTQHRHIRFRIYVCISLDTKTRSANDSYGFSSSSSFSTSCSRYMLLCVFLSRGWEICVYFAFSCTLSSVCNVRAWFAVVVKIIQYNNKKIQKRSKKLEKEKLLPQSKSFLFIQNHFSTIIYCLLI